MERRKKVLEQAKMEKLEKFKMEQDLKYDWFTKTVMAPKEI